LKTLIKKAELDYHFVSDLSR